MKKIKSIFIGAGTLSRLAPGLWKYLYTTPNPDQVYYIVANHNANANVDDNGGFNILKAADETVSIKLHPGFASEFAGTPKEGAMANYLDVDAAVAAIEAGTVVWGQPLFDNI